MSAPTLKARIESLEQELAKLKSKVERQSEPWWEQIAGSFANDPLHEQAMRLGREYRESLRPNTSRRRKRR
jgi:hypothetical protein